MELNIADIRIVNNLSLCDYFLALMEKQHSLESEGEHDVFAKFSTFRGSENISSLTLNTKALLCLSISRED